MSRSPITRHLIAVATVAAASSLALVLPGAAAAASGCDTSPRATQRYLAGFGDNEEYFVPAGGTFEGSAAGWSYGAARFVAGEQEPWKVVGTSHRVALSIPAGGSVTTPAICLRDNEPNSTFFFKPTSSRSILTVTMRSTKDGRTVQSTFTVGGRDRGVQPGAWKLASGFGNMARGNGWVTTYTFTVSGDAVLIDDLLIDPNCPGCRR